jgi:glycerol-3-phosphate dehydrogenase
LGTEEGLAETEFDLLVVGGGINGAAIARDAAGRGLATLLVERDDLAQHTSSASTKLIHGGLRYLETYEFRLVREALAEREVMLRTAAHLVTPLRFVLPHDRGLRPAWLIRLGLLLYDHIGGRISLPRSRSVRLDRPPLAGALKPEYVRGFEYSDARVDDSRLVVSNAVDAQRRGATIRTRTSLVSARRDGGAWLCSLEGPGGNRITVRARAIANAAGPWVDSVLRTAMQRDSRRHMRLIKGSHIVLDRLYEGSHAFILQNEDRRIVFAIPYERDFTLVGTTDVPWEGEPARPSISAEETSYLCDAVNRYFKRQVTPDDVRATYAGIRPLYDDHAATASTVTRDYVLDLDARPEAPPLLSVYGGKITTARRLAEHALEKLAPLLGNQSPPWTGGDFLPGGHLPPSGMNAFVAESSCRWPWLPADMLLRLAKAYGADTANILRNATRLSDLGEDFGAGLYAAEVDYLVDNEFARTAEDILWRRSKLGMHLPASVASALDQYLARRGEGQTNILPQNGEEA